MADIYKGFSLWWRWSRHHFLVKCSTNIKYQIKWKVEIIKTFVISFFFFTPLDCWDIGCYCWCYCNLCPTLVLAPSKCGKWTENLISFHFVASFFFSRSMAHTVYRLRSPQLNFRPNSEDEKKLETRKNKYISQCRTNSIELTLCIYVNKNKWLLLLLKQIKEAVLFYCANVHQTKIQNHTSASTTQPTLTLGEKVT